MIHAPDGGQFSLDWLNNEKNTLYPDPKSRPTVLMLPGLTGNQIDNYRIL